MKILEEIDIIPQEKAVDTSYNRFEINRHKKWGLLGHDIGMHDLNMAFGGIVPQKLTSIAARSGVGKTALSTQLFQAGKRIMNDRRAEYLFFTWEMSPDYLVDRHVCNVAGISNSFLTQGAKLLKGEFLKKVNDAYADAKSLPVIYQRASTDIERVKLIFHMFCEMVEKKKKIEGIDIIPVFIIDYVGMAKFKGKAGLRTYDIAEFMNELKQLVNSTNGAGIVLAQIGRGADDKDEPTKSDLSDSKSIEDASDNLVVLHRPFHVGEYFMKDPDTKEEVESQDKIIYKVEKSRDFGISRSMGKCDISKYRFWHKDHDFDFNYWDMYKDEEFWKKRFTIKFE